MMTKFEFHISGSSFAHKGEPRNRYSYHENPADRYDANNDQFSSLPRDHRFLSWKRDLRPPVPKRTAIDGTKYK